MLFLLQVLTYIQEMAFIFPSEKGGEKILSQKEDQHRKREATATQKTGQHIRHPSMGDIRTAAP